MLLRSRPIHGSHWIQLLACCVLLPLLVCGDVISPCACPGQTVDTIRLLSPRSTLGGTGTSYVTPALPSDLNGDYHAAFVVIPSTTLDVLPLIVLVSRVAEVSFINPPWAIHAMRYYNGSVLLGKGHPGAEDANVPEWLPGRYIAMAAGYHHICFLSRSQHILCRASDPSFDKSSGILFEHRANETFSQVSTFDLVTCGLRSADAHFECYGQILIDANSLLFAPFAINSSIYQYRSIAVQRDAGVCGITLIEGDLRCTTEDAARTPEALVPLAPLSGATWKAALVGNSYISGLALSSAGTIVIVDPVSPVSLQSQDQQIALDQVAAAGGSVVACTKDTARSLRIDWQSVTHDDQSMYFFPMRFIAVDPRDGDDDACACAITLEEDQIANFVACKTLTRAMSLITHSNTWLQLLPGQHFGGNFTIPISMLGVSTLPPPCFSTDELAQVANGSWAQRMAEAAAAGEPALLNCTGFTNCFLSSYFELTITGLSFTGASQHALSLSTSTATGNEVDLTLTDCDFFQIGGVLLKVDGTVNIRRINMTDATWDPSVLGLLDLTNVYLKLYDSNFRRNRIPAHAQTTHIRSCLRMLANTFERMVYVIGCSFVDNYSVLRDPSLSAGYIAGGAAVQLSLLNARVSFDSCTFVNNVAEGVDMYGGSFAVETIGFSDTDPQIDRTIRIEIDHSSFSDCAVGNAMDLVAGFGGCVWISEHNPRSNINNRLSIAAEVVLSHTTFTNGRAQAGGGCVSLGTLFTAHLSFVDFVNCSAIRGGAINLMQLQSSQPQFQQLPFQINTATFTNCQAVLQGGAFAAYYMSAMILFQRVFFTDSSSNGFGGAMMVVGCKPVNLEDAHFLRSRAAEGGTMYLLSTEQLELARSTVDTSTAMRQGGFVMSLYSALRLLDCLVTDATLAPDDSVPTIALSSRLGGAVRMLGGTCNIATVTFLRCSALPQNMDINSCATSYDAAKGLCSTGLGGALSMELTTSYITNINATDCSACTGAAIHVKGSTLVNLIFGIGSRLQAYTGAFLAAQAVDLLVVSTSSIEHAVALRAGGAMLLCNNLQARITLSTFSDVHCEPAGRRFACDGGVMWVTSQRQSFDLSIADSHFIDWSASLTRIFTLGGSGGILFTALDRSDTRIPTLLRLDEPLYANTFNLSAPDERVAMFGPLQASTVVSLTPSTPTLSIYPGQSLADLPELVRIYALDAYSQVMTQDRALVVQVRCTVNGSSTDENSHAKAAAVTFAGSTLQQVFESDGAATFGDLRVFASPGRYWLVFSLVTLATVDTHIDITVSGDCPNGLYYESSSQSCVPCPSDVLVYDATLNVCAKCPSGWERKLTVNDTSGPLRDGVSCVVCPLGQVSTEGSTCAPCGPNTYQPTPFSDCVLCSDSSGLVCADGLARVEAGYFAMSEMEGGQSHIETFLCPESFCSAAPVQRVDVTTLSAALSANNTSNSTRGLSLSAVNAYDQCAFPRLASPTNLLCGECAEGYRPWGNRCSRCDSVDGGLMFGLVVLSLVLLGWLIRSSLGSPSAGHAVVVLYFVQTAMLELGSVNTLLAWLNIVLFSPNAVGRCVAPLTPYQQTQAQILMPLALWIELMFIALIHFLAFKRWGTMAAQSGASRAHTLPARLRAATLHFISRFSIDIYISATFSLLLFAYTQVAVACVSYLRCVRVGSESVVFSQPSMRCESAEYARTKALVIFALVTYVAGLPVGIAAFLWKRSDAVREAHAALAMQAVNARRVSTVPEAEGDVALAPADSSAAASFSGGAAAAAAPSAAVSPATAHFLLRYAPLFAMYSPSAWFWQVFVLCRRTVFVIVSVTLLPTPRRRFMAFTLSTLVSLLFQLQFRPFRLRFFNRAELSSHVLLIVLAVTLTSEVAPYSTGLDAFIFLLVVPPIALYILYTAFTTMVLVRTDKKEQVAELMRRQIERENEVTAITAGTGVGLSADEIELHAMHENPARKSLGGAELRAHQAHL